MGSGNLVRLTMTKLSKPNYYYDGNDDSAADGDSDCNMILGTCFFTF